MLSMHNRNTLLHFWVYLNITVQAESNKIIQSRIVLILLNKKNNLCIVLHIHLGGHLLPVTPGDPLSSSMSPTSFLMAVNCFLFSIGACCIEGKQVKQRCLSHITKEMKVRIRVYE